MLRIKKQTLRCLITSVLLLGGGGLPVAAQATEHLLTQAQATHFRAGVRNAPDKRQLNAGQRKQILQSLRAKTGWQALAFDEAGFLVCPEPNVFSGGSAAARRLLGAALWGGEGYELEAHHGSTVVTFARLAPGTNYEHHLTGARLNTHSVQLDFADFAELRGVGPAMQSFDCGIAILHELAHGVWQLRDAASGGEEPGECESYINQIRRELGLPERERYQAPARLGQLNMKADTRLIAELCFVSAGEAKPKRYRLQWDAEAVGTVSHADRTANGATTAAVP